MREHEMRRTANESLTWNPASQIVCPARYRHFRSLRRRRCAAAQLTENVHFTVRLRVTKIAVDPGDTAAGRG